MLVVPNIDSKCVGALEHWGTADFSRIGMEPPWLYHEPCVHGAWRCEGICGKAWMYVWIFRLGSCMGENGLTKIVFVGHETRTHGDHYKDWDGPSKWIEPTSPWDRNPIRTLRHWMIRRSKIGNWWPFRIKRVGEELIWLSWWTQQLMKMRITFEAH